MRVLQFAVTIACLSSSFGTIGEVLSNSTNEKNPLDKNNITKLKLNDEPNDETLLESQSRDFDGPIKMKHVLLINFNISKEIQILVGLN